MNTDTFPNNVIMDFGLISVLLIVGHLLRSRIRLLQNCFVPTSVIAGFLGLLGGWQCLDWLPFSIDKSTEKALPFMLAYPGLLVVPLFATLFMGKRVAAGPKRPRLVREVGDTFFYNLASIMGMYGLALLFGLLILQPVFKDLPKPFALMLPAGFVGGHGTAAAVADALGQSKAWDKEEALTIGSTFATVGLLAAIFGGLIAINIATRKGWTRVIQSARDIPKDLKTGFVPEHQQTSVGKETVNPMALDPLTWHLALVLLATGAAFYVKDVAETQAQAYGLDGLSLPAFCLALLIGALIQKLLDIAGVGQYVDRRIMTRIGSMTADYLIAFAIASIQITVVVKYATPILLLVLLGLTYCVALFWFVGRRMFQSFWFEKSLFVYGWNTGVVGIGIMLLRIVDPRLKTRTLQDFGVAYILIAWAEIGLVAGTPMLVAKGMIGIPGLQLTIGFVACILLSRLLVGWFTQSANEWRDQEQEIVAEDRP